MDKKVCSICEEEKPVSDYHKGTNGAKYMPMCKTCRSIKSAEDYRNRWFMFRCRGIKSDAKKKGLPFDLDKEYLEKIWTDVCPVFGGQFVKHDKTHPMCPALDRVIPSKGYTKGNVVWISSRANRIKYDATIEEVKMILKYMETH